MYWVALIVCLVALTTDWLTGTIPNRITVLAFVIGAAWSIYSKTYVNFAYAGLVLAACYLICTAGYKVFNREIFGGGDIKLLLAMAMMLGAQALDAILLSLFLSAAAVVWRGVRKNEWCVPYAPWLFIGLIASKLTGA